MIGMSRGIALAAAVMLTGGCALLPDSYSNCSKPQPYQSEVDVGPLRVPAGSDLPDTRNALHIPDVKAPERAADGTSCLDHPPSYGTSRPQPQPG